MIHQSIFLQECERKQKRIQEDKPKKLRLEYGQFFTPAPIADFMASCFRPASKKSVHILDAGAGCGMLFSALVDKFTETDENPESISVTAYETDPTILDALESTMESCKQKCQSVGIDFSFDILKTDFISDAAKKISDPLLHQQKVKYTHAILNPPYKKINSATDTKKRLLAAGINTVNLYSAFVWLATELLEENGELVAITPRSFCNGTYFEPFRKTISNSLSIEYFHLFKSRKSLFSCDDVLQENIIFYGIRKKEKAEMIKLTVSSNADFEFLKEIEISYSNVIKGAEASYFIHLPEQDDNISSEIKKNLRYRLSEIGISVSTGKLVDFRASKYLLHDSEYRKGIPLIYPANLKDGYVQWPVRHLKKPMAVVHNAETETLFLDNKFYVLIKRFSSKEESRRIKAALYDPTLINSKHIAFENHLNVLHSKEKELSFDLALGLTIFLNSSLFDSMFREFSGHTQVNAGDLRKMSFPSRQTLERIAHTSNLKIPDQNQIDNIVKKECSHE